MIIGVARTCENMTDLRDKVNALGGKYPVQLRMYLLMPKGADPNEPTPANPKVAGRNDEAAN
jgi:hypothetical protein